MHTSKSVTVLVARGYASFTGSAAGWYGFSSRTSANCMRDSSTPVPSSPDVKCSTLRASTTHAGSKLEQSGAAEALQVPLPGWGWPHLWGWGRGRSHDCAGRQVPSLQLASGKRRHALCHSRLPYSSSMTACHQQACISVSQTGMLMT